MTDSVDKPTYEVQGIEYGTVIDHIPSAYTLKVVELLSGLEDKVLIGINFDSKRMGRKGVVKIANRIFTEDEVNMIALFAPQATINVIEDGKVVQKIQVKIPKSMHGSFRCPNPQCITNHQDVVTHFLIDQDQPFFIRCYYCERQFVSDELKLI
ncbi:MAG: aspartate carbamoyltransferase regulatory subunit [Candidatus Coatesbacteria bacterium]|nr:aspartate carbamoyltransferase regulatory subunit [Candidatus Coatesbacteria bacterium]